MKTKSIFAALTLIIGMSAMAQDRTTVTATTDDISDNLDLRAVASLFGDAENLEEFERMLNDPKTKISNLDLNRDNQVDYLRVVESVQDRTHLIVIQAVLERDVFQDVATVEVERDRNNKVQIQVVGDTFMYGPNYIYEPVYGYTPVIYNTFWANHYRPYWSTWYWGYYPSWYYGWHPVPVYSYCNNVALYVNHHHHYNYVSHRRSSRAVAMHSGVRANGYRTHYDGRAFEQRASVKNRRELDQIRNTAGTRTAVAPQTRTSAAGTRSSQSNDQTSSADAVPVTSIRGTRAVEPVTSVRSASQPRTKSVTVDQPVRSSVRTTTPSSTQPRQSGTRTQTAPVRTYTNSSPSRSAAPSYDQGVRQKAPTRYDRPATQDFGNRSSVQPQAAQRGSFSPQPSSSGSNRSSSRR